MNVLSFSCPRSTFSAIVIVAVSLLLHVAPFLPSSQLAITSQPSPPSVSIFLVAPLVSSRLRNLRYTESNQQHPAPTVIVFGHDNTLPRKLIILRRVGIFRVIFSSTRHISYINNIYHCYFSRSRGAARVSYTEVYPAICSKLRREDYFASAR